MERLVDDIDSAFNDILLAEDRCHQQGFADGLETGKESGFQEGYQLGRQQGCKVGTELGFYEGFTLTSRQLLQKCPDANQKKLRVAESLLKLLESVPLDDPHHVDLPDQLARIRAKFKQLCSLLDVVTTAAEQTQALSF